MWFSIKIISQILEFIHCIVCLPFQADKSNKVLLLKRKILWVLHLFLKMSFLDQLVNSEKDVCIKHPLITFRLYGFIQLSYNYVCVIMYVSHKRGKKKGTKEWWKRIRIVWQLSYGICLYREEYWCNRSDQSHGRDLFAAPETEAGSHRLSPGKASWLQLA